VTDRTCCCGKPLRDQQTVCGDCVNRLRRHLADQAAHLDDLETELARQTKKVAVNDGGRASDATGWIQAGDRYLETITADDLREWDRRARAAAAVIHEQRNLLVSWCRLALDEHLAQRWPADTIPAMSALLVSALPRIRQHDAAPDLVAEFRALNAKILKVIDTPENRTRIHVGPCAEQYTNESNQQEPCPGEVEAIVPADESIPPVLRCRACKVEYRSDQWVRAGSRIIHRKAQMEEQFIMARAMSRK